LTAFYKEIPKIKNPLCVFCNQITCYPVLDETIIKYDDKWRWFYCSVVKQKPQQKQYKQGLLWRVIQGEKIVLMDGYGTEF
jgi:hypothetical protein